MHQCRNSTEVAPAHTGTGDYTSDGEPLYRHKPFTSPLAFGSSLCARSAVKTEERKIGSYENRLREPLRTQPRLPAFPTPSLIKALSVYAQTTQRHCKRAVRNAQKHDTLLFAVHLFTRKLSVQASRKTYHASLTRSIMRAIPKASGNRQVQSRIASSVIKKVMRTILAVQSTTAQPKAQTQQYAHMRALTSTSTRTLKHAHPCMHILHPANGHCTNCIMHNQACVHKRRHKHCHITHTYEHSQAQATHNSAILLPVRAAQHIKGHPTKKRAARAAPHKVMKTTVANCYHSTAPLSSPSDSVLNNSISHDGGGNLWRKFSRFQHLDKFSGSSPHQKTNEDRTREAKHTSHYTASTDIRAPKRPAANQSATRSGSTDTAAAITLIGIQLSREGMNSAPSQ